MVSFGEAADSMVRFFKTNTLSLVIALIFVAIIVVIAIVLAYSNGKSSVVPAAAPARMSNLNYGGNNPQWYAGGVDSGKGGSVFNALTERQMGPAYQARMMTNPRDTGARKEGYSGNTSGQWVKSGANRVEYTGCEAPDGLPSSFKCGRGHRDWNPAAIAETQALIQVGALPYTTPGNDKTYMSVANGTHDSKVTLSDDQFRALGADGSIP